MSDVKTIKMIRPDGKVKTADVHPDEVKNWQNAGWEIAEKEKPAKQEKPPEPPQPKPAVKAGKK